MIATSAQNSDFGHRSRVRIIEVGMRDGLQIESKLVPARSKIDLINDMIESGISHLEITSFVSPRAVPQLADAEEVLEGVKRQSDTFLMALVPNLRAAARAADTSLDGGVLLCSASETHNLKNLNRGIDESISGFEAIADRLRAAEIEPLGGLAVVFGCPFEGEVHIDNVRKIARRYSDLGITHLTLGDTTGMATPANVRTVVRTVQNEFPDMNISLHLHNTRGVGLANVLVGLDEGIRCFDSSVGGLGGCPFAAGATGNICTEDLVYLLQESGYETGVNLDKAIAVAHRMERILDKPLAGQVMRAGPRLTLHTADSVRTAAG